jgi:para-aminobenzoate synthetase / 4-amino-4-deoxychorismate lyase
MAPRPSRGAHVSTAERFDARFDSFAPDGSHRGVSFAGLVSVLRAETAEQVPAVLEAVARAGAEGFHCAGFVTYEAAAGFGREMVVRARGGTTLPLAAFGVFTAATPVHTPNAEGDWRLGAWEPSTPRDAYDRAVREIRERIAAGETYQVNHTLRLRASFAGCVESLYAQLCRSQGAPHNALLRVDGHAMVSASPELFFRWDGSSLQLRPMKGTRPRGRWPAEDEALAGELLASSKERAENLMIVDLLRNDAGRVARFGSVRVRSLWDLETYPTVHHLTSSIVAETRPGVTLGETFRALFPCGSVTGAPKISTMGVIAELEPGPRHVYTGAIGYLSAGEACFSVAIRTLEIDETSGTAELGVGSGITWDSSPESEYAECLAKAAFVRRPPDFELLETLLAEAGSVFLLDEHLERLRWSAERLGFELNEQELRTRLEAVAAGTVGGEPLRLRLRLGATGSFAIEEHPLHARGGEPVRVAVAELPVDSREPLLYHKTTRREIYDTRRSLRPDCGDVILVNERGELTESTIANLVVRLDGCLVTPPVSAGLLPGTFRAKLLRDGTLRERTLRPPELATADEVYLINSVRRWQPVTLVR